jgi:hypothetical protein
VGGNLFAEFVSMLAGIGPSLTRIQKQSYVDANRLDHRNTTESVDSFETAKNGLNFLAAPHFFNNLPPENEEYNMKAIKWVAAYPQEFEGLVKTMTISLPVKELTEEERAEQEREAARLALEAAEVRVRVRATRVITKLFSFRRRRSQRVRPRRTPQRRRWLHARPLPLARHSSINTTSWRCNTSAADSCSRWRHWTAG